jgi:hypothetical protein
MDSVGMIYIPSFMNIDAGIKKLLGTQTQSKVISQPYSYFSEIWEVCCKDTLPNMAQDVYNPSFWNCHTKPFPQGNLQPYVSNCVTQQFPKCAQPNDGRRTLPRLLGAASVIFADDNNNHNFNKQRRKKRRKIKRKKGECFPWRPADPLSCFTHFQPVYI